MTVVARKNYIGEPRDAGAKFGSNQLIYLSWDRHLLFAAPFVVIAVALGSAVAAGPAPC